MAPVVGQGQNVLLNGGVMRRIVRAEEGLTIVGPGMSALSDVYNYGNEGRKKPIGDKDTPWFEDWRELVLQRADPRTRKQRNPPGVTIGVRVKTKKSE